jgi:methionyl-tRNA formyltransferase
MARVTVGPITRLLLFGGGELAVALAEWGAQHGLHLGVITSPRHAAETLPVSGGSLSAVLASKGIATTVVEDLASEEARLAIDGGDMSTTFCLSLGAAWIFEKELVDGLLGGRLFNLHGSRLPQNRGGGGFSWQILTGNRLGFCTLHLVDEGVDTGDVVAFEEFIYPAACRTPADYMKHYRQASIRFLADLLTGVRAEPKEFELASQPEYLSTYWPRLHSPSQAWIDWRWTLLHIERFMCAFDDPYCGAQTTWRGRTVRAKRAFASYQDGTFHPFQAGTVYRTNGRWICVACNEGSIVVEALLDERGTSVLGDVRVGDAFYTPAECIANRTQRVAYTALGLKK